MISLWGDPKTGLPVRIEQINLLDPTKKTTMSDFTFNVDLDESLFSLEPPAGYTTQTANWNASRVGESDLVETLRLYSQRSGGRFPDSLVLSEALKVHGKHEAASGPNKRQKGSQSGFQESTNDFERLSRGLQFAVSLPPEAGTHYAGKGVSRGTADTPIFWYRPKDGKTYRVICADLSVREADTPPNVPNAQRVPAPPSPKN